MLLAVDTATRIMGLGLHDGDAVLAEHLWRSANYHTVELAPEVALMLRRGGVLPQDLRAIAVAQGPGSFTGLRIGMALAKGLALAYQLPLIAIPTLDILAAGQPPKEVPMVVFLQAGRGRVVAARYRWTKKGWRARGKVRAMNWEALQELLADPCFLCGEFTPQMRAAWKRLPGVELAAPSACVRRPAVLAEMGWARLRKGDLPPAGQVAPLYLKTKGLGAQ